MDIYSYLMSNKRFGDLYILSRYMYKIGLDIINNEQYDFLETVLKKHRMYDYLLPYYERTYDDDPAPYELIKEFNLKLDEDEIPADIETKYPLADYLATEKSMSIDSVYSIEDSYNYFKTRRKEQQDIIFMLKVDGLNNKILYVKNNLYVDLSRGRGEHAKPLDYTYGARRILPARIEQEYEMLKVFGESYVEVDYLPTLRETYDGTKYKTPKGASKSLLVRRHADEDYKYLKILIFKAEGLGTSYEEMFSILEEQGVSVVPYKLIRWQEIPNSEEELKLWIEEQMLYFSAYNDIPSDGIVVDINTFDVQSEIVGKYDRNQIALKFGDWKAKDYTGIVKGIKVEQQRVYCSVIVEIEPMVSDDNSTLSKVDPHNLAIIFENDIHIGSTVYFERDSGTITKLVRNKK